MYRTTSPQRTMNQQVYSLTFAWILCLQISGIHALYCLQCSSEREPGCDTAADKYLAKCTHYSAIACKTYIGNLKGGGDVVERGCASHDMGSFCMPVGLPYGDLQQSVCLFTCGHSGCNNQSNAKLQALKKLFEI